MASNLHPGPSNEFGADVRAEPLPEFVPALFAARSIDAVAVLAVRQAERVFGCRTARIVTLPGTGEERLCQRWPVEPLTGQDIALVDAVLTSPRGLAHGETANGWTAVANALGRASVGDGQAIFLAEWPNADCVPESAPQAWRDFLALLGARITEVLELETQRLAIKRLEKNARLQKALYTIADLASGEMDMTKMLHRIHAVVGELMYARNFYIALYDAERDSVRFIYFADEKDLRPVTPDEEFTAEVLRDSLTLAVIRRRRSAMGPSIRLRKEFGLGFDTRLGPESADWLGVPMVRGR